jgi:hypothetical protein
MVGRLVGLGVAVLALSLFGAGCGSSNDNKSSSNSSTQAAATPTTETETDSGSGSESEGARTKCKDPATTKKTGLPAAFPVPGEFTVTQVRKDGPSVVVDGYWTSGLKEAYREWKDQFEQAGYKVLFNELEEHDSEVSYSGSSRTGQVALRDDCTEPETTRVHITNRPA